MKYLIIIIFSIFIVSCSDAKGTEKFLESQGYSDIKTYGFDFWAHGKDDWSTTRFIAKASDGKYYEGAVSDKGPMALFRPKWNLRIWKEVK
jgi:hypothetical protein